MSRKSKYCQFLCGKLDELLLLSVKNTFEDLFRVYRVN